MRITPFWNGTYGLFANFCGAGAWCFGVFKTRDAAYLKLRKIEPTLILVSVA